MRSTKSFPLMLKLFSNSFLLIFYTQTFFYLQVPNNQKMKLKLKFPEYHVDLEKRGWCGVVARVRHESHMSQ